MWDGSAFSVMCALQHSFLAGILPSLEALAASRGSSDLRSLLEFWGWASWQVYGARSGDSTQTVSTS